MTNATMSAPVEPKFTPFPAVDVYSIARSVPTLKNKLKAIVLH
ncbi:hypothetical protein [Providencia heimbachae]|uniref:Uncharacterized protein n=1 Tax=Providencia heimbachae ATCC 35613 TaxID=1354272 RepID=A0A1B7JRC2_9GAMM|nr:hypothetical protein [Providencia heimbachae]OAT50463.1 hypothetical protein M998_2625 [Providencia heimbachae ATCC 35613]